MDRLIMQTNALLTSLEKSEKTNKHEEEREQIDKQED